MRDTVTAKATALGLVHREEYGGNPPNMRVTDLAALWGVGAFDAWGALSRDFQDCARAYLAAWRAS